MSSVIVPGGVGSGWLAQCGRFAAALALFATIGGCANIGGTAEADYDLVETEDVDPLEGLNRQIFAANLAVDTFLLRPAAVAYREIVPEPGKLVIRNFVNHLKLPFTLLNELAQGELDRAGTTLSRFLVNTVLGIGGLFDPATGLGLPYQKEDFGQTLAVWGMEDGPYLVLPLLGPSNFRDAIGTGIGTFTDPVKLVADAADLETALLVEQGIDAVDMRYRHLGTIDSLRERSLDFYATARSLYQQRRANDIRNGGETTTGDTLVSQTDDFPQTDPEIETASAAPEEEAPPPPATAGPAVPETSIAQLQFPDSRPVAAGAGDGEPSPPAEGSSYDEAVRAFEEAQRAYERALRSVPEARSGSGSRIGSE